jgi:hypothetical protein
MAQSDPTLDPSGGDWWTQNQPTSTVTAPTADTGAADKAAWLAQVQGFYQQYLGRPGSQAELEAWLPSGIAGAEDGIKNSAEAKAHATQNNPEPATPPPDTNNGTVTGNTGAVPFGVPTSGFGAAPPPYVSNPNAPVYQPLDTYRPPTWTGGDFVNPTIEDLYNSPGYGARLDSRMKAAGRQFAAQGTILNGGTLKALDRTGQDYATGEYQTLRGNAMEAYKQKYSQFTDAAGMDLTARTVNANQNQNTFANNLSTYNAGNARTLSDYLTNATTTRNSELDYWNRLKDVNDTGANLAVGSR